MARLKSHSTPTSNGNTQGDGHAAKGATGDRPAPAIAAADTAKAQLKRKPVTAVVATSESCFVFVSVVASSVTVSQVSSFALSQKLNKLNQVLLSHQKHHQVFCVHVD